MESPFKGKTGLRRIFNAARYSMDGLRAAYRYEDAFRQEIWLTLVAVPLALWLGEGAVEQFADMTETTSLAAARLMAESLPELFDRLTPGGVLPDSDDAITRWFSALGVLFER